jgi:ABC-type amino acid transport substrate-binding protein
MRVGMPGKWCGLAAVGLLALGALAACGDDGGGDDGALRVCSDIPYPPMEFEEDGEYTGFDIELVREIANRLDRELRVVRQPFDGILLAVAGGECDLVASSVTITEERAEQVLFSEPYFDADQSLLVRAEDEERYATLDDLAGRTIGVQLGTTGETYAQENTPEGATIDGRESGGADLFLALESGDVDAILQDYPVNAYRAQQDDSMVVTETYPTGEQYGFAADQDNQELIDDVNRQLEAIREDGTYDELYEEWFGEPPS